MKCKQCNMVVKEHAKKVNLNFVKCSTINP